MREAKWLKSNSPEWMLRRRRDLPPFDGRKLRLFGIACCRRVWDILVDERSRAAVEALERFLDGRETRERVAEFTRDALLAETTFRWNPGDPLISPPGQGASWSSANAVLISAMGLGGCDRFDNFPLQTMIGHAASSTAFARADGRAEGQRRYMKTLWTTHADENAAQADLLREILGNPFRPVTFEPSWLSPDVMSLARAIAEGNDFSLLPILGDALEEAGCDRIEVLSHCSRPAEHVRGCWVLDGVLGRPGPFEVPQENAAKPGDTPRFWRAVRHLAGFNRG